MLKTMMMVFLLGVVMPFDQPEIRDAAEFEWKSQSIDLGKIVLGSAHPATFEFVNTGSVPLVIASATASCGCTVADFSREPVAPGEKGRVEAVFSAKVNGTFQKTIVLTANTPGGLTTLRITGEVVSGAE